MEEVQAIGAWAVGWARERVEGAIGQQQQQERARGGRRCLLTKELSLAPASPPLGGLGVTVHVGDLDQTQAELLAQLRKVGASLVCKMAIVSTHNDERAARTPLTQFSLSLSLSPRYISVLGGSVAAGALHGHHEKQQHNSNSGVPASWRLVGFEKKPPKGKLRSPGMAKFSIASW